MTDPYYVDHWFTWSNGELRKKRYDYEDYKEALRRFDSCAAQTGTTRVVLRKRGQKPGTSTALTVYTPRVL
ncbi:MAG: hypothetical protein Q4Q58_04905 [Thermoplasmata archaeon]|nr:hypothetical protein [Thermoplasmata archaeon]